MHTTELSNKLFANSILSKVQIKDIDQRDTENRVETLIGVAPPLMSTVEDGSESI